MAEKETKKMPAKAPPEKAKGSESLLTEFGAPAKKAPPAAPEKKPSDNTVKNADTAPAPKKNETKSKKNTAEKQREEKKSETAPVKKSTAPDSKKETAADKAQKKEPVHATTASPKKDVPFSAAKKEAKPEVGARKVEEEMQPRSARPAHKVIPYVLLVLAIFIGVSLILNLLCNPGNVLKDNPSTHWMGTVGYYVCYVLFGLFGPAVFVLPMLMLLLAFFWKRYIDRRVAISKIVASLLFPILLGAVIHAAVLVIAIPIDRQNLSAAELMYYGAEMTGGGVLGGKLGYFLYSHLNITGTVIVGICVLALLLFYVLGLTPQNLWDQLRAGRRERAACKVPSASEQEAEQARNKAKMQEKIRKSTSRQSFEDACDDPTGGAVEFLEKPAAKKSPADKLAPMPLPRLDPNDGSRPFVPRDIGTKLNEAKKAEKAEAAKAANAEQPAAPNPAKNRDTAVDPIFPRTEGKQTRRVPKEDRNFDLKNVFIDLQDSPTEAPRKHAPIPPEVPLTGKRPASAPAQAPTARPATGATPAAPSAAGTAKAPAAAPIRPGSVNAVKASATPKPVFRQADKTQQKDFGLSSEEFERLEAQNAPIGPSKSTERKAADKKPAANAKKGDKTPVAAPEKAKKYIFPPISYLHPGEPMTEENRAEIRASMDQLSDTLASFHVKVQEINYSCGPTVTRYEVVLAAGVRVRTVTNLADDIALALRSSGGVRIEAPIPGTNAVGIEVPNKTRSTIYLRDLIESKAFTESKSKLTACLGADIAGAPLIFDIAKMPHLLIAGTTGSGKSVCINCIITSLLYKVRPDEVRLILIDPKKVEFGIYKNIPHLMAPVVTQPKDAAGALQAAVEEMERRFELFESVGARNLQGYNDLTKDDPDMPDLPNIVIIIDELADLMMTAKNEVETAICRIAQKARAAGMHLIIGTQRPSADVVTGLIKANVPSSIAFAVKSQIDSRVILDHGGAEALVGRGDMLFVPIGAMRDTRVQGAFVDDKEVEKICEFIRATNGTAQYDEKFISKLKELAAQCGNKNKNDDPLPGGSDDKGDDPKYADAVRVAIEEKRISTSLLQRKLEVGYSRAAKLIDRMQSEGIVSAPDGAKARTILISAEEYLERFVDGKEES
ncbi:MAG: DNA translocase FtsK 4TM domain-containing protein [Clostridia bacterium]|nr:DNA translocase FtsK 4TM domain-containing protein [Clostridia bacterium]